LPPPSFRFFIFGSSAVAAVCPLKKYTVFYAFFNAFLTLFCLF